MWTVRPHRTSSWPTEGQSDMPTGEQPSVVVIGAGLAGLGAAERLRRNGIASIVLEASERPGGRVRTDSWHEARIELGGMFLVPAYTKLIALAQDLGLGDEIACADEGLALAIHKAGAWRYLDMADPRSVPRSGLVSPLRSGTARRAREAGQEPNATKIRITRRQSRDAGTAPHRAMRAANLVRMKRISTHDMRHP